MKSMSPFMPFTFSCYKLGAVLSLCGLFNNLGGSGHVEEMGIYGRKIRNWILRE
jgi:hypothetical protein